MHNAVARQDRARRQRLPERPCASRRRGVTSLCERLHRRLDGGGIRGVTIGAHKRLHRQVLRYPRRAVRQATRARRQGSHPIRTCTDRCTPNASAPLRGTTTSNADGRSSGFRMLQARQSQAGGVRRRTSEHQKQRPHTYVANRSVRARGWSPSDQRVPHFRSHAHTHVLTSTARSHLSGPAASSRRRTEGTRDCARSQRRACHRLQRLRSCQGARESVGWLNPRHAGCAGRAAHITRGYETRNPRTHRRQPRDAHTQATSSTLATTATAARYLDADGSSGRQHNVVEPRGGRRAANDRRRASVPTRWLILMHRL